jgi:hypothetical protein
MSGDESAGRAKARVTFFRREDRVRIHHGHLPHWRQEGVTYFVTSRLGDSMPQEKLLQWKSERDAWLRGNGVRSALELDRLPERQRHEFHATFTRKWHDWLDAGYGECLLRQPSLREILIGESRGTGVDERRKVARALARNDVRRAKARATFPAAARSSRLRLCASSQRLRAIR